ncbi:MAG: hypothetical protein H7A49_03180 [Akkermansiaceae bacterium]|nr:hypothetical protein [Akkermansiaceae bacterium]
MTGHTANDYFRQLIAADIAQSEIMFFAKTAFSNRKPDDRFDTADDALKPGDVGFGYLMNGDTAFDNKESPGRVLVCAPLAVEDGHVSTLRFDRDMYDQKAVVLKMDNSVISLNVNRAGEAILGSKPLLATGEGTVWGVDATPTVVPPAPGEIRFASSVTKNSGPMIWIVSAALLIVFLLLMKLARPTADQSRAGSLRCDSHRPARSPVIGDPGCHQSDQRKLRNHMIALDDGGDDTDEVDGSRRRC